MLAWWMLVPTLLAMTVALVLPGFMWLRAGVRSSLVAIGAAPAFTFGLITMLSVLYPALNIEWEPSTVMPVLGLSTLGGAIAWSLSFFRRTNGGFALNGVPLRQAIGVRVPIGGAQAAVRAVTWSAVLGGFLLAAWPLVTGADPANPVQQWDPTFHQNGVHAILYGKDASPFGGLHELYGGRRVYYPTGWHAFVALFARYDSVIQTSNVSSLALMGVWVTGLAALVSVLTASRSALIAAPIIGGTLLNMPADALTMYNQWPNSTGTVLVPGLAAAAIVAGRRFATDLRDGHGVRALARRVPQGIFMVVGCLGLVGAHPSAAFSFLAFLAAPLLASIASFARSALGREGRGQLVAIAWVFLGVTVITVPILALASPKISAMGRYPRSGSGWGEAFSHAFLPYPPFADTPSITQWSLVQLVLLIAGVAATARLTTLLRRPDPLARAAAQAGLAPDTDEGEATPASAQEEAAPMPAWPIVSYLILAFLTGLAYAPNSALRTYLLAPWYKDARRIMGVEDIALTVLMAVGFAAIVHVIHAAWTSSLQRILAERGVDTDVEAPRWPVQVGVGALILILSGFGAIDARYSAVAYVYDPMRLGKPGMATKGELAMVRRMRYTTAPDALVLGDPIAGAAYSETIGGRKAVFPQLSTVNADSASQKVLTQHFRDIHTDPDVCEVVRNLGITHFYEEEDGTYYNFMRSSRNPGLYGVDTTSGFELVDAGGTAKLWKITACGYVTPGGGSQAFADGIRSVQPGAESTESPQSDDE